MRTIVCLGDSLTGPPAGRAYLDKYVKWPDLVQVGVDAALGEGSVRVLNRGVAGDPSAAVLAALDERLLRHKPDATVVWIGANNYGGGVDRAGASERLRSDLTLIVERAQVEGIRVLLLQYFKPRAEVMDKVWTHGDAGNAVIAEVAAATGAAVLALAPFFEEAAKAQPLAELASPVDGLHLNPGGELVVAKAVLAKLRALNWPLAWPGV